MLFPFFISIQATYRDRQLAGKPTLKKREYAVGYMYLCTEELAVHEFVLLVIVESILTQR